MQGKSSGQTARQRVERLVNTYGDLVLRLGYARLGSVHDAQDICQTVFLKLLKQVDEGKVFADPEHEKAWVIRVAINACADVTRSGWRTKVVPFDALGTSNPHDSHDAGELEEDAADNHEAADGQRAPQDESVRRQSVLDAVNTLSPVLRQAIYLHYYEGYSTEEISRLTGDTPDTVRKHLSRGRAKLRGALEGEGL